MNLSQFSLATLLLLTACNRSDQSDLTELRNNPKSRDSSSLLNEKTVQLDSATTAQKKQLDSLIAAARDNNVSLAISLIQRGANANGKIFRSRYFWDSPLSEAARRNNIEVARILIDAGADPNLELGENLTPFHYSAGGCSSDVGRCSDTLFNLLLFNGGKVNTFNKYHALTPLCTAIRSGDLKKTAILIKYGAVIEPDSLNAFQSPLGLAVSQLHYDIVSLLLEEGANPNATYSEMHEDCLLCPADITVVHALVSMYNYANNQKVERILDLVLRQKPDLNSENAYGFTPLEFAAFGNNTALVDKLLKHGAKLETQGSSALHCAAQFSNIQMVELLLKYKINVNIRDASGNTPLYLCLTCCGGGFGEGITETKRAETIELLLNHRADPTIENDRGESFIGHSKKGYYQEVTKALIKRGLLTPEDVRAR
jgi:ankyrin repeat protein